MDVERSFILEMINSYTTASLMTNHNVFPSWIGLVDDLLTSDEYIGEIGDHSLRITFFMPIMIGCLDLHSPFNLAFKAKEEYTVIQGNRGKSKRLPVCLFP